MDAFISPSRRFSSSIRVWDELLSTEEIKEMFEVVLHAELVQLTQKDLDDWLPPTVPFRWLFPAPEPNSVPQPPHQFIPYTSHSGWKKYLDSPMIRDSQTPNNSIKRRVADSLPSPNGSRGRRLATDKPLDVSTIPTDEPLDLCTHSEHF
ncbi:hypothetical protein JTE90_003406 [Oedothorax gibbosus]|uniref:Uncharacterized protein n=1 Tax=Oedothorax gibbosus TaxID=931172 RepID=A0AAV6TXK1_9ARAC|nr:hypothetical protein JTE90_003406 [Oedothorax gibbosus]